MSIAVPLHGFSSGEILLNFKIVRYETKEALLAAAPAENTIGVITEVDITSWSFSPVKPAESANGMAWITTGKAASVTINLLKRNALIVYPQLVWQCVDGVLVNRDSYCYQNGAWTPLWFGQLYAAGDEWEAVTGGWTATALKSNSESGASAKAPTIARGASSITASTTGGGVFHPANKIDLTEFNTLTFRGNFTRNGSAARNLMAGCWKEFGTYYDGGSGVADAYTMLSALSGTELVVDISSISGEYIVGLGLTDSTAEVTEVRMSV